MNKVWILTSQDFLGGSLFGANYGSCLVAVDWVGRDRYLGNAYRG